MFSQCFDKVKPYFTSARGYLEMVARAFGIYALWILAHYLSSHLYVRFCVNASAIGFLISPFLVPAPHCQGLRWMIANGACNINAMWLVLSTWIVSKVIPFRNILNSGGEKEKDQ
jgi:hypothetical protein